MTTLLFSDKNVDSNLIAWNRVVLLHGKARGPLSHQADRELGPLLVPLTFSEELPFCLPI